MQALNAPRPTVRFASDLVFNSPLDAERLKAHSQVELGNKQNLCKSVQSVDKKSLSSDFAVALNLLPLTFHFQPS
jgi:hypothetical protein